MQKHNEQMLKNGVKLVGEMLLPGTSLLLDEKIRPGMAHAAIGILARVVLGVPGLLLVAANSYTQSTTGTSLIDHLRQRSSKAPRDVSLADKVAADVESLISRLRQRSSKDPRDVSLADKVAADVAGGLTYDEIRAGIVEDIEDLYHEATTGKTPKQDTQ